MPVFNHTGEVVMVLDVDSDELDDFSEDDKEGLEKMMQLLQKTFTI